MIILINNFQFFIFKKNIFKNNISPQCELNTRPIDIYI